ncbi:MAG: RNA repair transcriptional activator RtcR [Desulforhopalus sp.]
MKKTIVIGLLGSTLDNAGFGGKRWERWRPTVSLCQHEELLIDRFDLLFQNEFEKLMDLTSKDVSTVSPETKLVGHKISLTNPWDFEEVFALLHDFAKTYEFNEEDDYYIHISTGTHVAQICLFLLTEARYFPARLIQSGPGRGRTAQSAGTYSVIDLDLSKYDRIASRFQQEWEDDISFLKSGIKTRSQSFNRLIEQIEKVAIHSVDPILLTGPTGAGKSRLARRIYELKKSRRRIEGDCVEVNCATLRGENAMSALFGHSRGAYTGAVEARRGLLRAADNGLLFLDEIGELGVDEQAMLLRAIEEKKFLPVGSDTETASNFQLICGSNRDLQKECETGRFREDLLARINLWTFQMPGLRERPEDIEPNFDYELDHFCRRTGSRVTINKEARETFLEFAASGQALWAANFRDLGGAVTRMATLAEKGRITVDDVKEEINRLQVKWRKSSQKEDMDGLLVSILGDSKVHNLDVLDRVTLGKVVEVCRASGSMAEAGRVLFNISRLKKRSKNDSDRLRKYLAKFDLDWNQVTR